MTIFIWQTPLHNVTFWFWGVMVHSRFFKCSKNHLLPHSSCPTGWVISRQWLYGLRLTGVVSSRNIIFKISCLSQLLMLFNAFISYMEINRSPRMNSLMRFHNYRTHPVTSPYRMLRNLTVKHNVAFISEPFWYYYINKIFPWLG